MLRLKLAHWCNDTGPYVRRPQLAQKYMRFLHSLAKRVSFGFKRGNGPIVKTWKQKRQKTTGNMLKPNPRAAQVITRNTHFYCIHAWRMQRLRTKVIIPGNSLTIFVHSANKTPPYRKHNLALMIAHAAQFHFTYYIHKRRTIHLEMFARGA